MSGSIVQCELCGKRLHVRDPDRFDGWCNECADAEFAEERGKPHRSGISDRGQIPLIVASVSSSILAAVVLLAFQWATAKPRSDVSRAVNYSSPVPVMASAPPPQIMPQDSRTASPQAEPSSDLPRSDSSPLLTVTSGNSPVPSGSRPEPAAAVPSSVQPLFPTNTGLSSTTQAPASAPMDRTEDVSAPATSSNVAMARNDAPKALSAEVSSDASPEDPLAPVTEPKTATVGSDASPSSTLSGRQLPIDLFLNAPVAWKDVPDSVSLPIPEGTGDSMRLRITGFRPAACIFKRSLLDLNKGEQIARLPAEFETEEGIVSPDAANVVRIRRVSHSKVLFYLHPVSQLDRPEKLDVSDIEELHFAEFLTNHLLLLAGEKNSAGRIEVFDISSRNRMASYPVSEGVRDPVFSVSPSGSELALASGGGELRILNLVDGSIRCTLDRPRSETGRPFVWVRSLQFSADGKEIVGTIFPSQIVVWTTSNGSLTLQETVPDVNYELITSGRTIEWLPDNSGWLVGGRKILDRKTMSVVWVVDSESYRDRDCDSCLLSQDQVLVPTGDGDTRRLVPVRIPWNEIRSGLAKCKPTEATSLLPGSDVAVEVKIQQLRVNNNAAVQEELTSSAEKVATAAELSVAPNAKTRMVIHYSETASVDHLRNGLFPALIAGRDPDSPKINTDIAAKIELQNAASGEIYWSKELESTGGLRIEGERNEQSLRASAFAGIKEEIEKITLPTFLCPGVHGQLPVVSKLP